jgi:alpha-glucosidase
MATPWWRRAAVYQVYPRSFADADGDGVGDLAGLTAHLEHPASLGAGAVWLSPVFPSPMADFGYDVADFCDIDPVFGTLADFDALVGRAHALGLRVVLDWVPNHTSDRHPWFQASRSGREDPKRDWYVWRDGAADGGPPNDWQSVFDAVGPAWTRDEATGQWYLHSFLPQQPDLNWDNPEVEAAMHDVLRFWLERGVDGFRLDAIAKIAKDPELRSNADATVRHDEDWPTIHERLRRIRRVVDAYGDRLLVGEVWLLDPGRFASYVRDGDQLHLAHNFAFLQLDWDAAAFRAAIDDFDRRLGPDAWATWFLSNHDSSRVVTRYDHDGLGAKRARAIALMLYALRGTPFVYQGEELGLPDAEVPPEHAVDVDGRDAVRAPIPWAPPSAAGPGAGFTTGKPWLPLPAQAEQLAVAVQERDPGSMLAFVRRLAALRDATPALSDGDQRTLDAAPGVLAWERTAADGSRVLAAVNFTGRPVEAGLDTGGADVLLSSVPAREGGSAAGPRPLWLQPAEGVLLALRR